MSESRETKVVVDNLDPIKRICEIDFMGISIQVFYDKYQPSSEFLSTWSIRNPDSEYRGIVYVNQMTGEVTYPPGTIPESTREDRELVPKSIIIGVDVIDNEMECLILDRLQTQWREKNKKDIIRIRTIDKIILDSKK